VARVDISQVPVEVAYEDAEPSVRVPQHLIEVFSILGRCYVYMSQLGTRAGVGTIYPHGCNLGGRASVGTCYPWGCCYE